MKLPPLSLRLLGALAIIPSLLCSLGGQPSNEAKLPEPLDPSSLAGRWHVAYADAMLGEVLGEALVNYNGTDISVSLEHPQTEQWFELASSSIEVEGQTLVVQLEGRSPHSQPILKPDVTELPRLIAGQGAANLSVAVEGKSRSIPLARHALADADSVTLTLTRQENGDLAGSWRHAADPLTERDALGIGRVGRYRQTQTGEGLLGEHTGDELWWFQKPKIDMVVVVSDQLGRTYGTYNSSYAETRRDGQGRLASQPNSTARTLLVIGEKLPIRRGDRHDLASLSSDKIEYRFVASQNRDEYGVYGPQFEEGWNRLRSMLEGSGIEGEALAKAMRGFQSKDVLLLRAQVAPRAVPGTHTFTINGARGEWPLLFGDNDAQMSFARSTSDVEFQMTDTLFTRETVRLRLLSDQDTPIQSVPVVAGINEQLLPADICQALTLQRKGPLEVWDSRKQGRPAPIEYLSPPIRLYAAGETAPPAPVGGIVLPVSPGNQLNAKIAKPDLFNIAPTVSTAWVHHTPAELGSTWKEALAKAARCAGIEFSNFNQLGNERVEEISNFIITEWSNREIHITVADHAAMLLLREEFVRLMRNQLREYEHIQGSAMLRLFGERIRPHVSNPSSPFSRIEIDAPNGHALGLDAVFSEDWIMEYFRLSRAQYRQWADHALQQAVNEIRENVRESLEEAESIDDCDASGLLEITGYGFDAVGQLVAARLVKLEEMGSPKRLEWVPDRPGRSAVLHLGRLADAVRALDDYAELDTTFVIVAATAAVMPLGWVGEAAMFLSSPGSAMGVASAQFTSAAYTAALGADLVDLGYSLGHEVPEYFSRQAATEFHRGAMMVTGTAGLDEAQAREKSAAEVLLAVGGSGLGTFGSAANVASSLRSLQEAHSLAELRRAGESVTDSLASGDLARFRELSPEQQATFAYHVADAERIAAEAGSEALTASQRQALDIAQNLREEARAHAAVGSSAADPHNLANASDLPNQPRLDLDATPDTPSAPSDGFMAAEPDRTVPPTHIDPESQGLAGRLEGPLLNDSPSPRPNLPEADLSTRPLDPDATVSLPPRDPNATLPPPRDPNATVALPPRDPNATVSLPPRDPNATVALPPRDPNATLPPPPRDPNATVSLPPRVTDPSATLPPPSISRPTVSPPPDLPPRRDPYIAPPPRNPHATLIPPRTAPDPHATLPPPRRPNATATLAPRDSNATLPPPRISAPPAVTDPNVPPVVRPADSHPTLITSNARADLSDTVPPPRPPSFDLPPPKQPNPSGFPEPGTAWTPRTGADPIELGEIKGRGRYATVYEIKTPPGAPKRVLKVYRQPLDSATPPSETVREILRGSELLGDDIPQRRILAADPEAPTPYVIQEAVDDDAMKLFDRHTRPEDFGPEYQEAVVELYRKFADKGLVWEDGHIENIYFFRQDGRWQAGVLDSDRIRPFGDFSGDFGETLRNIQQNPHLANRQVAPHFIESLRGSNMPDGNLFPDAEFFMEKMFEYGQRWMRFNGDAFEPVLIDPRIVAKHFPKLPDNIRYNFVAKTPAADRPPFKVEGVSGPDPRFADAEASATPSRSRFELNPAQPKIVHPPEKIAELQSSLEAQMAKARQRVARLEANGGSSQRKAYAQDRLDDLEQRQELLKELQAEAKADGSVRLTQQDVDWLTGSRRALTPTESRQARLMLADQFQGDWAEAASSLSRGSATDRLNLQRLGAYRKQEVDRLLTEVMNEVSSVTGSKLQRKAFGSTNLTSDYDLSISGPGAERVVGEFNRRFRARFGKESGSFFDTNVYTDPVYSFIDPSSTLGKRISPAQHDAVRQFAYEQMANAKYMTPAQWQRHTQNLIKGAPDHLKGALRRMLADVESKQTSAETLFQQRLRQGGFDPTDIDADVELRFRNDLYAEQLEKIDQFRRLSSALDELAAGRAADLDVLDEILNTGRAGDAMESPFGQDLIRYASLKQAGQTDQATALLEEMQAAVNSQLRHRQGMALYFASEAYQTQGTIGHVVGELQAGRRAKNLTGGELLKPPPTDAPLAPGQYMSSFFENNANLYKELNGIHKKLRKLGMADDDIASTLGKLDEIPADAAADARILAEKAAIKTSKYFVRQLDAAHRAGVNLATELPEKFRYLVSSTVDLEKVRGKPAEFAELLKSPAVAKTPEQYVQDALAAADWLAVRLAKDSPLEPLANDLARHFEETDEALRAVGATTPKINPAATARFSQPDFGTIRFDEQPDFGTLRYEPVELAPPGPVDSAPSPFGRGRGPLTETAGTQSPRDAYIPPVVEGPRRSIPTPNASPPRAEASVYPDANQPWRPAPDLEYTLGAKLGSGKFADVFALEDDVSRALKVAKRGETFGFDDSQKLSAAETVRRDKEISDQLEEAGIRQLKIHEVHTNTDPPHLIVQRKSEAQQVIDPKDIAGMTRDQMIEQGIWSRHHERALVELYADLARKGFIWEDGHMGNVYFEVVDGQMVAGVLDHGRLSKWDARDELMEFWVDNLTLMPKKFGIRSNAGIDMRTYQFSGPQEFMAKMLEHKGWIKYNEETGEFEPGLIHPRFIDRDLFPIESWTRPRQEARIDLRSTEELSQSRHIPFPKQLPRAA